jgi:hypothetical protein
MRPVRRSQGAACENGLCRVLIDEGHHTAKRLLEAVAGTPEHPLGGDDAPRH